MKSEEITKRQQVEAVLQQAHDELEIKVEERTAELRKANEQLRSEIVERKRAEEDIRKALEKQKDLSELKSRFVSMTSHEFRTPLTTILSSAELIEKYSKKLTEEKKIQHLHRIQTSVKHLTQLLNNVLLIGKAEAGKIECKPAPLGLV